MQVDPAFLDRLMVAALEQAELASSLGEVPIGAVIAHEGEIISRAHNEIETTSDATAHAEILAIRRAASKLENWRLTSSILCVTIEPCTMCCGAIKLSRIPHLVFGAHDPRLGACGSLFDLSQDKRLGPVPEVTSGVRADECRTVLQSFFVEKRKQAPRF